MTYLDAKEVVVLLKEIISGRKEIVLKSHLDCWNDFLTLFEFYVDGYFISIFVDAGEIDYIEEAVSPDNRRGDYDFWTEQTTYKKDPIEYLSENEVDQLRFRFEEASRKFNKL